MHIHHHLIPANLADTGPFGKPAMRRIIIVGGFWKQISAPPTIFHHFQADRALVPSHCPQWGLFVRNRLNTITRSNIRKLPAFNNRKFLTIILCQYTIFLRSFLPFYRNLPIFRILTGFSIVCKHQLALRCISTFTVPSGQWVMIQFLGLQCMYVRLIKHTFHIIVIHFILGVGQMTSNRSNTSRHLFNRNCPNISFSIY